MEDEFEKLDDEDFAEELLKTMIETIRLQGMIFEVENLIRNENEK